MSVEDSPVVTVGPVAHGGHCVARLDGRVVFVRHALPGEVVRLRVTERAKKFWRADAVEVLSASPDRVEPPCRLAGVCGGCDFQHAAPAAQRELLRQVVAEQLRRLAGIDWDGEVEAVSPDALGWRTRVTWAVDPDGRPGLRQHRSHQVVAVDDCPIADPRLPDVALQRWDADRVEAIVSSTGERMLVTDATVGDELEPQLTGVVADDGVVRAGAGVLHERVGETTLEVTGSGFWQVHPRAASTLVAAVLAGARVRPGDRVLDLYSGAGLFSAFLAQAGAAEVVAVEADRVATADAARNLPGVRVVRADVVKALAQGRLGSHADVVVLDPPRTGAKAAVAPIAALQPRRIVYVACDPAALARDLAAFASCGYRLESLRAFALFPMTHHVECVAVLTKTGSDLR